MIGCRRAQRVLINGGRSVAIDRRRPNDRPLVLGICEALARTNAQCPPPRDERLLLVLAAECCSVAVSARRSQSVQ